MGSRYDRLPIKESFFVTSIIGFIISAVYTYSGYLNLSFGFAFTLVFLLMFISSFVAIAPKEGELEEYR